MRDNASDEISVVTSCLEECKPCKEAHANDPHINIWTLRTHATAKRKIERKMFSTKC